MIEITVHGLPAPQGSKRHVGRGVMVESSKNVKPWRSAVVWAAISAAGTEAGSTTSGAATPGFPSVGAVAKTASASGKRTLHRR